MCVSKPSRRKRAAATLLSVFALLGSAVAQADELAVLRITPSGEDVAGASQVVVHFSRAMVPLGRMERAPDEVPARISPDPGCQWRWLDAQALACNLVPPQRLRAATQYVVEVAADAQALDGARLRSAQRQAFITGRPDLDYASVMQWSGPGEPEVRARFNQPVTAAAVAAVLRFGDVGVQVEPQRDDGETPFYTPQGEARRSWRLRPLRALTPDRAYELRMAAGLKSALGTQPGVRARSVLALHTFPSLRLLGIQCEVEGRTRVLTAAQGSAACAPLDGISLAFNAPVSPAALRPLLRIAPDPRSATQQKEDPWAGAVEQRLPRGANARGQVYTVPLPFGFAAESDYQITVGGGLQDVFGRRLDAPGTLALRTGARAARLVFDHEVAVLESKLDSEVPVVVTNLQGIDARFDRLTAKGLESARTQQVEVAAVRNLAFAMPLEVRGMLGSAGSGALRGEVQTRPQTSKQGREFFAVVTPWQVHAKFGHSNLLVWVTSMADGAPVAAADVAVLDSFGGAPRASAATGKDGVAQLPGAVELDPELKRAWSRDPGPLYVRVQQGADIALLPLSQDFAVDTWRASREQISAWRRQRHGHLKAWGTTAQGVYRAGDRVQYKVYVRDDAGRSLAAAAPGDYRLQVFDPTGTLVHERAQLKLSAFGAASGEFALTERAAVGWYRFELQAAFADGLTLEPMRVLVSDFVPAPFRVQAELRAKQAQPGDTVVAALRAQLHGGGAFAQAPTRLTARVQLASFEPDGPLASRYSYDTVVAGGRDAVTLPAHEARLDAQGEWTQPLPLQDVDVLHGRLVVEGSVQDDRGRSITAQAGIPYFGRDRYIGMRTTSYTAQSGQAAEVEALVVDAAGLPQAGVPYYVRIERMERRGARVKGAGNAYITRYTRQWTRVANCQGRSKRDGMSCRFTPAQAGEYRMIGMVRDSQNRLHETQQWLYVQGPQAVLWEETPDYSLDLRADKAVYRSGQTARLLVKNPFPGARAMVTVERYGVLDHWVQTLAGNTPVIEVPIKPEYLPGAYVSVIVMSPRVQAPPPSAASGLQQGVDLGKPTFRMGYVTLKVDDPHRAVTVEVKPERKQYRPGERVGVALQAQPRTASGEPVELAVAVLDEAVFDLIQGGTAYFDPLKGFTSLEPLDLTNYSLLTQLIGRQKFEKKGANAGGDGGADLALRSIDQFVAYWNPSLPTDAQGRARIELALPDNLTGWRVLALAVTPSDRMGLGQGSIAVSKPTELRPAMPNQAMLGDRFDAGFTVLNRESSARTLKVELAVSGGATGAHEQSVSLQPYERRTVYLPVEVKAEQPLRFTARAGDAADQDALAHTVALRLRPYRQLAADASSLVAGQQQAITIELPETAQRGELRVALSPSVIGGLEGAFGYLRDYPHACWEQQLSRAVMAAHYLKLKPKLADTVWPQAETLPQATLDRAAEFQAPGGGVAFWVAADEHQSPYLSAFTALAFGWLRELGYTPPQAVSDRLNVYLKTLLKDDIAVRGYESAEARAQVRAVALAALAQQKLLTPAELQRYATQLPRMGLFGQSLYLQAAAQVPDATAQRGDALDRVLARGRLSAGRLALEEDRDSATAWMLGSEVRSNCAALSGLMALPQTALESSEWPTRLVRAITQARGTRVHWLNTQENLYCTRALIDYADRYEREPVALTARIALDQQTLGSLEIAQGQSAALTRSLGAADAGVSRTLDVNLSGSGRGYVDTQLRYVERLDAQQPVSAGFGIERRYAVYRNQQWQALTSPLRVQRGERIKVEIEVAVPAWMTYVVVDDPVPGGLEPINPDLATAAGDEIAMDLGGGAYPYPFYHRELRFDAVRHYADYVAQGRYRLSWIGQAVATGEFAVDAPRVEALYDPDIYATGASARLMVDAGAQ